MRCLANFFEDQLGDVSAAIVSHVNDQRVAIDLAQIAAVKFGEAARTHVGDVHVADGAARALVDDAAMGLDPLAVARGHFIGGRPDSQHARQAALRIADSAKHFGVGEIHQQRVRMRGGIEAPAANGQQRIAFADVQTRRGQRRAFRFVPRITADNVRDAPRLRGLVVREIRSKKTDFIMRRFAVVAAEFVGVRRSQFALHLPQ